MNSGKQRENSQKIKTLQKKIHLVFTGKGIGEMCTSDPFLSCWKRKYGINLMNQTIMNHKDLVNMLSKLLSKVTSKSRSGTIYSLRCFAVTIKSKDLTDNTGNHT